MYDRSDFQKSPNPWIFIANSSLSGDTVAKKSTDELGNKLKSTPIDDIKANIQKKMTAFKAHLPLLSSKTRKALRKKRGKKAKVIIIPRDLRNTRT